MLFLLFAITRRVVNSPFGLSRCGVRENANGCSPHIGGTCATAGRGRSATFERQSKVEKATGQSLMRLSPDAQRAVRGGVEKVLVRREQREFMTDAELCE